MKNFGWSNRQEIEFKGVLANVDLTKLPDELVARIAASESAHAVLAGAVERGLGGHLGLPAPSEEDGEARDGDAVDSLRGKPQDRNLNHEEEQ